MSVGMSYKVLFLQDGEKQARKLQDAQAEKLKS